MLLVGLGTGRFSEAGLLTLSGPGDYVETTGSDCFGGKKQQNNLVYMYFTEIALCF